MDYKRTQGDFGEDGYVECGDGLTHVKTYVLHFKFVWSNICQLFSIKLFKEKVFIVAFSHKDSNVYLLVLAGSHLIQTLL